MKIELLDVNKFVAVNEYKEVTSPIIQSAKGQFHPEGILSTDIFGIDTDSRRRRFGYINLTKKFMHPHVHNKVLGELFRDIHKITSGIERYSVDSKGILYKDPRGWTGLESLYNNWDKINWRLSKDKSTNERAFVFLENIEKDLIFLDKFPVCPPLFRDVKFNADGRPAMKDTKINPLYSDLLRYIENMNTGGLFGNMNYSLQYKLQEKLFQIADYFCSQLRGKYGLFKQNLMGKRVDYGSRVVISAPTYNNNHINDNMVDLDHTALPLSQACAIFYPFIESWLINFFTREIINKPNLLYYIDENGKVISATIKDPEVRFSQSKISKMIKDYVKNPNNRFKLIEMDVVTSEGETKKAFCRLSSKAIFPNDTIKDLNRLATVTDVLYLAAVDAAEKRHVMTTRYPIGTDKGMLFQKVRIQTTRKHIKVSFDGKEYPFYPCIDLDTPYKKIGTKFVDSMVISNSYMIPTGGDLIKITIMVPYLSNEIQEKLSERLTSGVEFFIFC